MHAHAKALDHLTDELCEPITIGGAMENRLPMVATQNDAKEATTDMQARRASQPCSHPRTVQQ